MTAVTGLTPGTTYHYRTKSVSASTTVYGTDATFTTIAAPLVSVVAFPSSATVSPGTAFDVTVNLTTSATVGGCQVALGFDPTKVQASNWTEGSFFSTWAQANGGSANVYPSPMINNTTGNVSALGIAIMGASTTGGPTGTGDLVTYHMTALAGATGTATFTLYNVAVSDSNTYTIPNPTVTNGQVTFQSGTTAPAVTTIAATNLGATTATVGGNLTSLGSAVSAQVWFQYGVDTSYGTSTSPQTLTATGGFTAPLTGLTASTMYHFRANVLSSGTTVCGSDLQFTTNSTGGATVATTTPTNIGAATATLNGNLTSLGSATSFSGGFDWGTTVSYGQVATAQSLTATGPFSATLSNLNAGTTYHFMAIVNTNSGTVTGTDMTFTTAASAVSVIAVPSSSTVSPGSAFDVTVNLTAATAVGGAQVALGFDPTKVQVSGWTEGSFLKTWAQSNSGTTMVYPSPVINNTTGNVSDLGIIIQGASGGPMGTGDLVTYHLTANASASGTTTLTLYDVSITDQNGVVMPNPTVTNGQVTFQSGTAASVTTAAASAVTGTTVTLNGNLTGLGGAANVSVWFDWGNTTSYGSATAAQTLTATGAFTASITGLTANTTYHFRANVSSGGTTVNGADVTFETTGANASSTTTTTTTTMPVTTQTTTNPGAGQTTQTTTLPGTGHTSTVSQVSSSPYVVDISKFVGSDGKVSSPISVDGGGTVPVILTLANNSLALGPDGTPLKQIQIKAVSGSTNGSVTIIGNQVDFGPTGATFNPPVTIGLKYDPRCFPRA